MILRWCVIFGLLALITAIGVACASEPRFTPIPTSTPTLTSTSTPTPVLAPEPSLYEELLRLIPDTPQTRHSVYINDYVLRREVWNIPPLGRDADEQALEEYLFKYFASLEHPHPELARTCGFIGPRQYLGFDWRDIDQSIMARNEEPLGQMELCPGLLFEGLRGRFDPEATDQGLKACSECPLPLREEYRGVSFYNWGDDLEISRRYEPITREELLGKVGRIAVQAKYVFHTRATDTMKALIDASLGHRPSLADVEEFRLLAKGMSALRAYTIFLTDMTQGWEESFKTLLGTQEYTQGQLDLLRQEHEGKPILRPYQAFATGAGKDESGVYTALVLVHADARAAQENVGLLRRRIEEAASWFYDTPWAQKFDTDRIEARAKGRVLLAKLPRIEGQSALWIEWVDHHDPLLLHE